MASTPLMANSSSLLSVFCFYKKKILAQSMHALIAVCPPTSLTNCRLDTTSIGLNEQLGITLPSFTLANYQKPIAKMGDPIDTSLHYRIKTTFTGNAQFLASSPNMTGLEIQDIADDTTQYWYFEETGTSNMYRLHTVAIGDVMALDVANTNGTASTELRFYSTGSYTGQFWRLDAWANSGYRFANNFTGADVHLDVGLDTSPGASPDTYEVFLSSTDSPGQNWFLSALNGSESANNTQTTNSTTQVPTGSVEKGILSTGAIVGIAIGGFFGLVFVLLGVFCFLRRRGKVNSRPSEVEGVTPPPPKTQLEGYELGKAELDDHGSPGHKEEGGVYDNHRLSVQELA